MDMPSSPPALIPAAAFGRIASPEPEGAEERGLHSFTVMSIASLLIMASKDHAEKGVEEIEAVMALWREMVSISHPLGCGGW